MSLKKTIGEGDIYPAWYYAVAHYDFVGNCNVCYPIPLHLVVRWWRDLIFWLRTVGRPGFCDGIYADAKSKANAWAWSVLDEERELERSRGYLEGWDARGKNVLADFDASVAKRAKPEGS